jgi:hypothetical protein
MKNYKNRNMKLQPQFKRYSSRIENSKKEKVLKK